MSVVIADTHPTYALESTLGEMTKDTLAPLGVTYFQYLRCFLDGSLALLTNDTRIMRFFSEVDDKPLVYSSFDDSNADQANYWFSWDETLSRDAVGLVRDKFNIHNGFTLLKRHANYYDMIGFASDKPLSSPETMHLTLAPKLTQFIQDFEVEHAKLITDVSKQTVAIPETQKDENRQKICLQDGRLPVRGRKGPTYVTAAELNAIRALNAYGTYKWAAKALAQSPRTVETLIERAKHRLGFAHRRALFSLLL